MESLDFLGFTFNGKHSYYDMGGVYCTIESNRITDNLSPELNDKTADVPGGDGMYYFGTTHKQKVIPVSFAFDHLTEAQLREWKKFCSGREISDLIFDERPYKVYSAKMTGTSSMKYLCFDEYNETTKEYDRVYKGEGTLQFTCYWPYAHTPDENTKVSRTIFGKDVFDADGKKLTNYNDNIFTNKHQWSAASGLLSTDNVGKGENHGDLPAHFVLIKSGAVSANTTFEVGNASITIPTACYDLEWNSKSGIVKAATQNGGAKDFIRFTGNSCGTIPVDGITELQKSSLRDQQATLKYHYWYY
jgi:predicted phage tail component-like protein